MSRAEEVIAILRTFSDNENRELVDLGIDTPDNIIGLFAKEMAPRIRLVVRAMEVTHGFLEAHSDFRETVVRVRSRVIGILDALMSHKAKPRHSARDKEIVRLRDEESLSWGKIAREIRSNKEMAVTQGDAKITVALVKQAYRRHKAPKDDLQKTKIGLEALFAMLELFLAEPFDAERFGENLQAIYATLPDTDESVPSTNELVPRNE